MIDPLPYKARIQIRNWSSSPGRPLKEDALAWSLKARPKIGFHKGANHLTLI